MKQTAQARVPVQETKASKPLTENPREGAEVGETPSLTGEFVGETYWVLECTQNLLSGINTRRAQFWIVG